MVRQFSSRQWRGAGQARRSSETGRGGCWEGAERVAEAGGRNRTKARARRERDGEHRRFGNRVDKEQGTGTGKKRWKAGWRTRLDNLVQDKGKRTAKIHREDKTMRNTHAGITLGNDKQVQTTRTIQDNENNTDTDNH